MVKKHPEYRVTKEDEFDLIHGWRLRHLRGGVLHLEIETTYKLPETEDAADGVVVRFGSNTALVRIANLDKLYQTWIETGRYRVEVLYVPVKSLKVKPSTETFFATDETVVVPE